MPNGTTLEFRVWGVRFQVLGLGCLGCLGCRTAEGLGCMKLGGA